MLRNTGMPVVPAAAESPERGGDGSANRRLVRLLAVATVVGSLGLAAGGTAGGLLATDLAGPAAAGIPLGLLVIGSAVGAVLMSRLAARGHRGCGLVLGYAAGVGGAALVGAGAAADSLPLVLAGSAALGPANSSVFLTRYAAAEAVPAFGRGRALGTVFFATAVGAVISPMLLGPSDAVAGAVGLPRFTGLYLVAMLAFGGAALLLAIASRPGGVGEGVLSSGRVIEGVGRAALRATMTRGQARIAVLGLTITNLVMVGIMTIAPVHIATHGQGGHAAGHGAETQLAAHGGGLHLIGAIVALHVLGMFAPAPISGRLADRFGPVPVMVAGGVLLLLACLIGLFVRDDSIGTMVVHLVVLGVGWNFGVIGASALLAGAAPSEQRPYAEGIGEMFMGLAAGVAGPVAGVAADLGGYWILSLGGGVIVAGALLVVHRSNHGRTPA